MPRAGGLNSTRLPGQPVNSRPLGGFRCSLKMVRKHEGTTQNIGHTYRDR
jgi:hypothetical protein